MRWGEDIGLGAVHVISGPRVVGPGTFAAEPAMGCRLPNQSSPLGVVALVVSA